MGGSAAREEAGAVELGGDQIRGGAPRVVLVGCKGLMGFVTSQGFTLRGELASLKAL